MLPDLESKVMRRQQRMKECYDRKSKARSINIDDPVFVKTHERTGPKWTPAVMHDRDGVVTVSEANDGRMIRRHMDHVRNRYPIVEDRVERPDMGEVDESGPMNDADTSVVRMPTPVCQSYSAGICGSDYCWSYSADTRGDATWRSSKIYSYANGSEKTGLVNFQMRHLIKLKPIVDSYLKTYCG